MLPIGEEEKGRDVTQKRQSEFPILSNRSQILKIK